MLFACTNVPLDIDDPGKGSKRRTRIFDMPFNFVANPSAANEKQIVPDLEEEFPARNPSFFFLLCQVRRILLSPSSNGEVTPVPDEVKQAVDEELREPWMDDLDRFVATSLRCVNQATQANTAAEVREAFSKQCDSLQKREIGLKLAAQGFKEESKHYMDVSTYKRTTKRVYSLVFPGGGTGLVQLK